jgi:hypothetical protein
MAGILSKLFGRGSRTEDALARYVIAETHAGRSLNEVLDDPYIKNRADRVGVLRLLDHPEVVKAVGGDAVARLRAQLDELGR